MSVFSGNVRKAGPLPDRFFDGVVQFQGRKYVFDNLSVEPESIVRHVDHVSTPVHDPLAFCAEILPELGVKR